MFINLNRNSDSSLLVKRDKWFIDYADSDLDLW